MKNLVTFISGTLMAIFIGYCIHLQRYDVAGALFAAVVIVEITNIRLALTKK